MQSSISRNFIFKFILNIFNLVVPILIGPYVIRKLGADMMGTINFAQSIHGYFFIFASFGVYQYGLREISRLKNDKEKLSNVFTSLFIITILASSITSIIYIIFIATSYSGTDMYVVSMILSFNFFANIFYTEWVNEALENFDFITIKTVIVRIIYILLLFIFIKSVGDFKEYVILLTLSTFANNIISFIYIKRRIKFSFKNIIILPHLKPLFLVVILSNANVLYSQLDKVMLGNFYNIVSVSYYTVAQSISGIINSLLLTVVTVSMPRLSNALTEENSLNYTKLLDKISKVYLLILFPACIGIMLLAKEITILYGGMEYINAYPILIIFSIYTISLGFESLLGTQVLYLNKKEDVQVKFIFIGGLINLILNFALVIFNIFNGVTAIFTTLISNIFLVAFEHFYIKKNLNLEINLFKLDKLKYFYFSLIFIPVTLLIKHTIFINYNYSLVTIILYSLIVVLINSGIYFILLYLTKDNIIMEVMNRLKIKLFKK